jgi:hypothetical protein
MERVQKPIIIIVVIIICDSLPNGNQRVLDSAVVAHNYKSLLNCQTSQYYQVRLLTAAAAAHSGAWLHAVPISACGLV